MTANGRFINNKICSSLVAYDLESSHGNCNFCCQLVSVSLQPDKGLRNSTSAEENTRKLPTLLIRDGFDDEGSLDKNEAGSDSSESESDGQILENSQPDDREVTTRNMTYKSAKVLLLTYSGQNKIDNINQDYFLEVLKEVGGKVSLGKSLEYEALAKAVAVKFINTKCHRSKSVVSLSNFKHSDVVICSKSKKC